MQTMNPQGGATTKAEGYIRRHQARADVRAGTKTPSHQLILLPISHIMSTYGTSTDLGLSPQPDRNGCVRAGMTAVVERPNRSGISLSREPQMISVGIVIRVASGRRLDSGAAKLRHSAAARPAPSAVRARATALASMARSFGVAGFR